MTEKEAIETLQEKSLERCEAFGFDCGNCDKCEVTIAYDMAIKALEKQIPKKPIDVCTPVVTWGLCPICKGELNKLGNRPNRVFESTKYCPDCGQALDWSDTDEMPNNKSQE